MRRTGRAIHANIDEAVYKCTKDIEKYGREAHERIKKAIETGVKAVHTAAVTKAPGGRTGNLRAGIKMSITSTGTTAGGNVRSTAPHGHLVEFGTKPRLVQNRPGKRAMVIGGSVRKGPWMAGAMPKKPFMRPAIEQERPKIEEAIRRAVEKK